MLLPILCGVALILCFMSAVNYYFQKQKYKYATDEVMKTVSFMEQPSTWSFFSILMAFVLLVFFCLEIGFIGKGLSSISNQQNTVNQTQEDTTSTTNSTNSTTTQNSENQQTTK